MPGLIARLAEDCQGPWGADQRLARWLELTGRPSWHGAAAGLHGIERPRRIGSLALILGQRQRDSRSVSSEPKLAALAALGSGLVLQDREALLPSITVQSQIARVKIRAYAETLRVEARCHTPPHPGKMVVEFQPHTSTNGLGHFGLMPKPPVSRSPALFSATTDR